MNIHLNSIKKNIEPLRQQVINHEVYSLIKTLNDLKVFMRYHVYAVWDFMSLLKALQNKLTCTKVPWFPVGLADTRYLVNEIVAGEESDVDLWGNRQSHFEIYLQAMKQCGADINEIQKFTDTLKESENFESAFSIAGTQTECSDFVSHTFNVINSDKDYLQAAVFTFGREDLIPGMFISIINEIHKNFPDDISIFKYYIERHIEVDGGHHSKLALQMTTSLCGDRADFWMEAENAVKLSLEKRLLLWDGVASKISA